VTDAGRPRTEARAPTRRGGPLVVPADGSGRNPADGYRR
jgi:hypothetical protein